MTELDKNQENTPNLDEIEHKRTIRSFVVRGGRMTEGQQKAYDENWDFYGLDVGNGLINYQDVFGRQADVVV